MAAVVVGGWDPLRTAIACIIFGAADAAQLRLQGMGSVIPYQFLQMLPYLITVVALTGMVKSSHVPKTWGAAYDPASLCIISKAFQNIRAVWGLSHIN